MAYDELEVKLKTTQIYAALYENRVDSLDKACELAGISRGTLYNWQKDFGTQIEAIRAQIVSDILAKQNERREYLDRAKLDAEAKLQTKAYDLVSEGIDIMADVMREAKSGFIKKAAFDAIVDAARNGLTPNGSKIVINNGNKDDDGPPQLPAHRPFQALPDPSKIKPATDVQLAREKVEQKFVDGTQRLTVTEYPQVIENETPSN